MKNIVFSSTKQWNPGDEFILRGITNLLDSLQIKYNSILFNRNPDIRGEYSELGMDVANDEDAFTYRVKTAIKDNSIKPWQKYDQISAIVFAGTPEWQTDRSRELYIKAITNNIPVLFIGIDSEWKNKTSLVKSVLKKAELIVVRNPDIIDSFRSEGISTYCKVCPSLFSSRVEKRVNEVRTIGLIYRANERDITYGNGWGQDNYLEQNDLFKEIIKRYEECKIIIICHYIDELFLAKRDFPNEEVRYSYDSNEYFQIYAECDLVIGSRIHGIGIASSLAIPAVPIIYDNRKGTMNLLCPEDIYSENNVGNYLKKVEWCFDNAQIINNKLVDYKKRCFDSYRRLLEEKLSFEEIEYDYRYVPLNEEFEKEVRNTFMIFDKVTFKEKEQMAVRASIRSLNELISGKKIVIKGAGQSTSQLLEVITENVEVVAITDRNKRFIGGYRCVSDEMLPLLDFDFVIVPSKLYEDEMIEDLSKYVERRKIVSIYDIVRDNFKSTSLEKDLFDYL